jgi:signal transduction histidine kinase
MRWRPYSHLTPKGRQIALVVVVVLLPISILAFMQYRSMVELEAKTKVAVKENLRQTLQGVQRKMEERFEGLAKEALLPISQLAKAELENKEDLETHFAAVASRHPEIDELFFISQCSGRVKQCSGKVKEEQRAYFFTQEGLRSIDSSQFDEDSDAHNAFQAYERARLSSSHVPESGHDFLFGRSCPTCSSKGTNAHQTYIFHTVHNPGKQEHIGFAGLVFNTDYIKKQFLARSIPELLQSPDLGLSDSNLALAIFDEAKSEIYANTKGSVEYEVKTAFSRPFPQWSMGIGLKETTIGALARSNFKKTLLLTLLVLSVLVFGIVQILRATAREAKLAQAKSDFVSNVSHELKTPLTMIRLFAEILSRGRVKNPEKAQDYYQIMENESRRLSQLIDNILDFSQLEAGRKLYQPVETDVAELVEGVIKSYEYQLVNSAFELKVDVQPNLPAIRVDPDAISQAVLNLLNNAVKYSDKIKKIGVRVFKAGESIAIEVSDSGIGIPPSEHQKIFEKFHRVGTALVHNTKGSGLGLSLVKHIVEAHRGQVRVESVPGEGSRFTLLLPLSDVVAATEKTRISAGGYEVAESLNN